MINNRSDEANALRRLEAALELLPKGCVLADIGCDHGFLGYEALTSDKAVKVYACDISAPSLDKARKTLCGLNAEFFHTDGFDGVPRDFTAAAVCGMGGETALELLSRYDGDATLVIQPQTHASDIRRTLSENGYMLEREILAFERGRFYPVMRFTRGKRELSELQTAFGLDAENPSPALVRMAQKAVCEHSSYPENERSKRIIELAKAVIENAKQ